MREYLTTTEFAEALGISESTARRLADRGALKIFRTQGGHRKIPLAEAIRYARDAKIALVKPELWGLTAGTLAPSKVPNAGEQMLHALREGVASDVLALMQSLRALGVTVAEICDGPLCFAMHAIDEAWPDDKRSIFCEHRATVICLRALAQLRLDVATPSADGPIAIGGAPQDDPYMLTCEMASLICFEAGFRETNLGPNTPTDVLVDEIEDKSPSIVWLSLTNPVRSKIQHREIERVAAATQQRNGLFLVGGRSRTSYDGPGQRCESMTDLRAQLLSVK